MEAVATAHVRGTPAPPPSPAFQTTKTPLAEQALSHSGREVSVVSTQMRGEETEEVKVRLRAGGLVATTGASGELNLRTQE